MSIKQRIAHALFRDVIQRAVNAAVSVRVDDSAGWQPLAGSGPHDRPWSELRDDLDDALEAWRKNFLIRRIVTLTRTYAVGGGIEISSEKQPVDRFIRTFWDHPKNRLDRRLGPMCDEIVRAGELFTILYTNKVDGMSYVRFIPASLIREVETDPDDYEKELRYGQIQEHTTELKWWLSDRHPEAFSRPSAADPLPPIVHHYAINRPIGATRGESDLAPVLKWALRYSHWLEDRVRLNRTRTRQGMLDIEIADDSQVEQKKYQLRRDDPMNAGIYIHGPGESSTLHHLQIQADDAEPDGRALRLAVAAGSGTALHYLGEGADVNYATAKEMGEPTARFYGERQQDLINLLTQLVTLAHRRYVITTGRPAPARGDLKLQVTATEVARADNQSLATAARDILIALREMKRNGWIDDPTAIRLAFKFAGETIEEQEIDRILSSPAEGPVVSPAGRQAVSPAEREEQP